MDLQFAENLQVIMNYYSYNQDRFATLLGTVNQKSISTYINGKGIPKIETLIRLRQLTGLSIDSLLFSKILVSDLPTLLYKEQEGPITIHEPIIVYEKNKTVEERLDKIEERLKKLEGK